MKTYSFVKVQLVVMKLPSQIGFSVSEYPIHGFKAWKSFEKYCFDDR